MTFKSDLKLGKQAERAVKNLFESAGFIVSDVDTPGKNDYHDMGIEHTVCPLTLIEVKFDRLAETTGNFCLEFYNPKSCKPSGINVTSSDIYVYVIPDGTTLPIWAVSVARLRRYMRESIPHKTLHYVGDGNASIHLYKLNDILKIFTRLDTLSPSLILQTIIDMRNNDA